jgi:hypothetical protein
VSELNTIVQDADAVVTPDDLTIYFDSTRPGGNPQSVGDMWTATRANTQDRFPPPTNVAELNGLSHVIPTFITRDGCKLYFSFEDGTYPGSLIAAYVAEKPAQ